MRLLCAVSAAVFGFLTSAWTSCPHARSRGVDAAPEYAVRTDNRYSHPLVSDLHREVAAPHALIASKLPHRARETNMPLLDDIGAVANSLRKMQVLLGQENRDAMPFQIRDHSRHAFDDDG